MSDKKFTGNFYKTETTEKMPDECPNCLYPNQKTEKKPDECPNCYYKPSTEKPEDGK